MKCVYCLRKLNRNNKTKDHILPQSWFSKNSNKLHALTVPSCFSCNQYFQKSEDELYVRFAMAMNPNTGNVSLLGMLRMFPYTAKDDRSKGRKEKIFDEVTADLKKFTGQHEEVIFTPESGRTTTMIRYPHEHLYNIIRKFVCSLEFKLRDNYLGRKRGITFWMYGVNITRDKDHRTQGFDVLLNRDGKHFDIGNDFKVTFVENTTYKDQVIYRITLWDTFQFYCFIHNLIEGQAVINQIPVNTKSAIKRNSE